LHKTTAKEKNMQLKDRVAIVTGAGNGIGKAHALALGEAGAKVVVNDLEGTPGFAAAEAVVEEIRANGGHAIHHGANVADELHVADMVSTAIETWGRIDILVNNAGILRDRSFPKMTTDEFRAVIDVHLMGAFHCSKAVWPIMREAKFGRIVMTTSGSGLYGNFGQANYSAAKMALVGLMNTLHIEGEKYDIRVNSLAPSAYTQMLEGLVDPSASDTLTARSISPGLLFLVSEDAPSKTILGAGAGGFAVSHIYETPGVFFAEDERCLEEIKRQFNHIQNPVPQGRHRHAFDQTDKVLALARKSS
jgi:NAD(P)-dependent dehydrogenase (short-subunit alcohol dehydrogenase family)